MATYNNENSRPVYYTIVRGKICRREPNGEISEFTGIDGVFLGIHLRTKVIEGVEKTFTDFKFKDEGENFVISCELFSSTSNTIVRCLANVTDFSKKILFEVWQNEKDGHTYTNISVKQDGKKIPWIEVPPIEQITVPSGETFKSYKKREDFIAKQIEKINGVIAGEPSPADCPEPQLDPPETKPRDLSWLEGPDEQ